MTNISISLGICLGLLTYPILDSTLSYMAATNNRKETITLSIGSYQSPLLAFRAYRTNPLYRTLFKLPLSSLTYSHSINPYVTMCRFETKGKCHNPSCTAQHWDTVTLSNDDIAKELLAYHPNITPPDLSLREQMTSSEWLLLIAHTVYQHQHSVLVANTEPVPFISRHGDRLIPISVESKFEYEIKR